MKKLLLCLFILTFSNFAYALTDAETQSLDYQRILEQKNQIEAEKRRLLRKQEEIERARKTENITPQLKEESQKIEKETAFVKDIQVEGVSVFSPRRIENIISGYLNRELSRIDIGNLQIKLQNLYMEKGYTLARVYIDIAKLDNGVLRFVILEGVIDKICFADGKENDFRLNMAFPFLEANVFNMRDIEQGLEQLNRLGSNNAVMNIKPAEKEGKSIVEIVNNQKKRLKLSAGVDNSGSKLTGEWRAISGLSMDNLLNLSDNLNVNYTRDLDAENDDEKYSKSLTMDLSIPFGYWTINASYTESKYLISPKMLFQTMRSEGDSKYKSISIERLISRGQTYRFSSGCKLTDKYSESRTFNVNTNVSQTRLVPAEIYLSNTKYLKNGSLFVQAGYKKGLDILDATKDAPNLSREKPRAQYELFEMNGYLYSKLNVPATKFPITYMLNFRAQYSEDTLYGQEQFGPSVRGFKDESISAESGGNITNDIKAQLVDIFPFFEDKNVNFVLKNLSLGVFYDVGFIEHKLTSDTYKKSDVLSGWGVSLSGRFSDYVSLNVAWANMLDVPRDDSVTEAKDVITCSLNVNIPVA